MPSAEVSAPLPEPEAASAPTGKPGPSLSRRSAMTFASNLILQFATLLAGLVFTPMIAQSLGKSAYGGYLIIQQMLAYIAFSDLSPGGVLKYLFGVTQHEEDYGLKRRQIGAALLLWVATLPLMFVLLAAVTFVAPYFVRIENMNAFATQMAVAMFMISLVVDRLMRMPALILRGMNMDYAFMGLNAVVSLIGTGLICLAAVQGYGLAGMATATVIGSVIAGVARLWVAKRALPWLGVERPSREETKKVFSLSTKVMGSSLSSFVFDNADVLVVGTALGTKAAAVYGATVYLVRTIKGLLRNAIGSAAFGVAGLCGKGEWERVFSVRKELQAIFALGDGVTIVTAVACNHLFVNLWMGESYYGGPWLTLMLALGSIFELPLYVETLLLASRMEFKLRSQILGLGGVITIVVGGLAARAMGPAGFAAVYAAVRAIAYVIFARSNGKVVAQGQVVYTAWIFRPILVIAFLSLAFIGLNWVAFTPSVFLLAGLAIVTAALSFAVMWLVALDAEARVRARSRLGTLKKMVRRKAA